MTADEFVAAIREAGRHFADPRREAMCRAWTAVEPRREPAFAHPPDPVLDLLARYDLSGVEFGHLRFAVGIPVPWDAFWQVASGGTTDYYVAGGGVSSMYYKAAHPDPTGVTSAQFLDLNALRARMLAAAPPDSSLEEFQALQAEFAVLAAAVTSHAPALDWFGESHTATRERHKPFALSVAAELPGMLSRAVVGQTIREPDPDVNPDAVVLPFLRGAAGRLVPKWTRSARRFDETCVWGRGELGGEDVCDRVARVGTAERHVYVSSHYREPEQEMFPTTRRETRRYTVCGLPKGLRLVVDVDRQWWAGLLVCAAVTFVATAPAWQRVALERLFRSAFEGRTHD